MLKFVKICQKFKAQSLVGHMRAHVLTNVGVRSPLLADKMGRFKNDWKNISLFLIATAYLSYEGHDPWHILYK